MEKDIDRIQKSPDTEIVIRIDDFGGKKGLTIREFVRSERYTGFTKAGTRIPADKFQAFRNAINSVNIVDLMEPSDGQETKKGQATLSSDETKVDKVTKRSAKKAESATKTETAEEAW